MLARFHVAREPSPLAVLAGVGYSRSLDFWGVQLQRAGELEPAAARFDDALKLNPDNVVAETNLRFNQTLRAGQPATVDLSKADPDQLAKYPTWNDALKANGPFDEPSFCYAVGNGFLRNETYGRPLPLANQALAQFDRVRALAPDYLPARFLLGQTYLMVHLPGRALDALRDPLEHPDKFALAETNEVQLHVLAAAAYFQMTNYARATELLETEMARHPDNNNLLAAAVQGFMTHGQFDPALRAIDLKLKSAPDDPAWLYTRGYVCIQRKDYSAAITALTRVLTIQTNNDNALFNRAIANLDSGRLDAARADYLRLQQTYSNAFPIAYGLGEIAWRQHDTNEAVRNYTIYLANAATNTGEAQTVLERLRELKK